jgi:hypothetical protein
MGVSTSGSFAIRRASKKPWCRAYSSVRRLARVQHNLAGADTAWCRRRARPTPTAARRARPRAAPAALAARRAPPPPGAAARGRGGTGGRVRPRPGGPSLGVDVQWARAPPPPWTRPGATGRRRPIPSRQHARSGGPRPRIRTAMAKSGNDCSDARDDARSAPGAVMPTTLRRSSPALAPRGQSMD